MYQKLFSLFEKIFRKDQVFKFGFNWSPMYRRTVARITEVSRDLHTAKIKISLNYKNRNYVGSIFGGSLFSATDPICMIQLIHILGDDYIVWDKAATIKYKKPARENAYAIFHFSKNEIEEIQNQVAENGKTDWVKKLNITDKTEKKVFCEVEKVIYIASKEFHKARKSN